ncbi:hypothetical protein PSTT_03655, partial [Puccinia striiformis]
MMVEGLSATVNLFQCPNPDKAQAMCSRTDGDTTVVEKPYPDGPGYYCSSNIKDASQNCCNLDFKIGATYPGISKTIQRVHFPKIAMWRCPRHSSAPILIRLKLCVPSQMVLQRNVSLNHLDRAKSLVNPKKCNIKLTLIVRFRDLDGSIFYQHFAVWKQLLCPADLVGPVKNCCNTDFKIQLNLSTCIPETTRQSPWLAIPVLALRLGGGLARRIVNPEAKPNKWPTASKSTFQLRFLVTMASSASFPAAAPTDGAS